VNKKLEKSKGDKKAKEKAEYNERKKQFMKTNIEKIDT